MKKNNQPDPTAQDALTLVNSQAFKALLKDRGSKTSQQYNSYEPKANVLSAFQNHQIYSREEITQLKENNFQSLIKTSQLIEKFRQQVGWTFSRLREAAIKAQQLACDQYLKNRSS